MGETDLHTAFLEKDAPTLEKLVEAKGYTERLDIMQSPLMSIPGDFYSDIYFHAQGNKNRTKLRLDRLSSLDDWRSGPRFSPKDDWIAKYIDHFTLIKQDGLTVRFVDCWTPRSNLGDFTIAEGIFHESAYDFNFIPGYKGLEENTKRILHLGALREHYPPLTLKQIILDINPPWIIPRAAFGFLFAPAIIYNSINGNYSGAAVAAGFELAIEVSVNGLRNMYQGVQYFDYKSVKLNKQALDKIAKES